MQVSAVHGCGCKNEFSILSLRPQIKYLFFRFRLVPEAFQQLHDDVERCMRRAIEIEEKIPMEEVINFDEVTHHELNKLSTKLTLIMAPNVPITNP